MKINIAQIVKEKYYEIIVLFKGNKIMKRKSETLIFDKIDINYSQNQSKKKVKEFIKEKDIYNIRDFEDDEKLYVIIIWDE